MPSEPRQLIIPKKNQYKIGDDKLFSFVLTTKKNSVCYRDNYADIEKNIKPVLVTLAKAIQLKNVSKMKKDELIAAITPYIRFE